MVGLTNGSIKERSSNDWLMPYALAIALGILFSGWLSLFLASLAEPERLVQISIKAVIPAIPFLLLLYLIGLIIVTNFFKLPNRTIWFTAAFVIRIALAFSLTFVFLYDDERAIHYAGIEQLYGLFSFSAGKGYYNLVAFLYIIFGPNILLPKIVNSLIGALLPFLAYDIGRWLFGDKRTGRFAFLFTAFLPPLVIYSAVNLKEIFSTFFLTSLIWLIAHPSFSTIGRLMGVGIIGALIYWFRGIPITLVTTIGVLLFLILGREFRLKDLFRPPNFFKLIMVGVGGAALTSHFLVKSVIQLVKSRLTREVYFIERFTQSEATIMQFLDLSNLLAPHNLLVLFLRGLYFPVPLRFLLDYNISTILEAFNMLSWYVSFPLALAGFLGHWRKGAVVSCGAIILGILTAATVGVMVGTDPYRHRIMSMGLLFVLASGGLRLFHHYRWLFYLWGTGAIVFIGLWLKLRI